MYLWVWTKAALYVKDSCNPDHASACNKRCCSDFCSHTGYQDKQHVLQAVFFHAAVGFHSYGFLMVCLLKWDMGMLVLFDGEHDDRPMELGYRYPGLRRLKLICILRP